MGLSEGMTMALSSRPSGSLNLYSFDTTASAVGAPIQNDSIATAQTARLPSTRLPSRSESPKIGFWNWVDGARSVLGLGSFIATPPGCILMRCGPWSLRWCAILSSRNLSGVEAFETLRRLALSTARMVPIMFFLCKSFFQFLRWLAAALGVAMQG